jgi:hypothetical protein
MYRLFHKQQVYSKISKVSTFFKIIVTGHLKWACYSHVTFPWDFNLSMSHGIIKPVQGILHKKNSNYQKQSSPDYSYASCVQCSKKSRF